MCGMPNKKIFGITLILTILAIIAFISVKFQRTREEPSNNYSGKIEKSQRVSTTTITEGPPNPETTEEVLRKPQPNIEESELRRLPNLKGKYIMSAQPGCGGLGNKLWTFASMYAIGRKLNRSPLYSSGCMATTLNEILRVFPEFGRRVHMVNIPANKTKRVNYGNDHCCKYEDPSVLEKEEAKFLEISGIFFQNIKFFHYVRNEVNQIFRFSNEVATKADTEAIRLFGSDEFHKLCVYTRRSDFLPMNISTTFVYTESATDYVYRKLQDRYGNVSVVLLGEDKTFLNLIKEDMTHIPRFYIPHEMPRGEDMCFGAHYCNSMIITAPASTFGWWMGYLMSVHWNETGTNEVNQQLGDIYYNSDFERVASDTYSFSNFPMNWIPLRVLKPVVLVDDKSRDDFNTNNISDKAIYL